MLCDCFVVRASSSSSSNGSVVVIAQRDIRRPPLLLVRYRRVGSNCSYKISTPVVLELCCVCDYLPHTVCAARLRVWRTSAHSLHSRRRRCWTLWATRRASSKQGCRHSSDTQPAAAAAVARVAAAFCGFAHNRRHVALEHCNSGVLFSANLVAIVVAVQPTIAARTRLLVCSCWTQSKLEVCGGGYSSAVFANFVRVQLVRLLYARRTFATSSNDSLREGEEHLARIAPCACNTQGLSCAAYVSLFKMHHWLCFRLALPPPPPPPSPSACVELLCKHSDSAVKPNTHTHPLQARTVIDSKCR